jgi:hypothetical protein
VLERNSHERGLLFLFHLILPLPLALEKLMGVKTLAAADVQVDLTSRHSQLSLNSGQQPL